MTLDEVVSEIESDLNTITVLLIKGALAALIPSSVAFFLTPIGNFLWGSILSPIFSWAVGFAIKQMDNAGYYLYKTVTNNAEATAYENAIAAKNAAASLGDANAIAAARANQLAAFKLLYPLTS